MKKSIRVIACVMVLLTLLTAQITAQGKETVYRKSVPHNNYSSSMIYVGKKYILANESGIFTAKSPSLKWKKITSKYDGDGDLFISDGNTIYFATRSGYDPSAFKFTIYSININGKKLKKIKTCKGVTDLIAVYKGNLYIGYGPQGSLYCTKINSINLKSKKMKTVSKKYTAGHYEYLNGRIYFSLLTAALVPNADYSTYCLNLKNGKIKKTAASTAAINMSTAYSPISLESEKVNSVNGNSKKNYIYTINSKHKISKSKKLPDNSSTEFVSKNSKYAYYRMINNNTESSTYYRYNLSTGAKTKIKGTSGRLYYKIIGDAKNSDIYFVYDSSDESYTDRINIYKLKGTKLVKQKINGSAYLTLKTVQVNGKWTHGNYWISGKSLITTQKGKIKTYKLS